MKVIIASFFLICFLTNPVADLKTETSDSLKWELNLERALKKARKQNKRVLVYFSGSDWCAPCKKLEQDFFENKDFEALLNTYVLVNIDMPRRIDILSEKQLKYNKQIISKYNSEKVFPKVILLNSRGKIAGKMSGYSQLRDVKPYTDFLKSNI